MSSTRLPKIEDFLKKEISQIISSQAKDPRYKFLNIVDVKCSSDLGVAKVFIQLSTEKFLTHPIRNPLKNLLQWLDLSFQNLCKLEEFPNLYLYTMKVSKDITILMHY